VYVSSQEISDGEIGVVDLSLCVFGSLCPEVRFCLLTRRSAKQDLVDFANDSACVLGS
jgi:hypothetical protein